MKQLKKHLSQLLNDQEVIVLFFDYISVLFYLLLTFVTFLSKTEKVIKTTDKVIRKRFFCKF